MNESLEGMSFVVDPTLAANCGSLNGQYNGRKTPLAIKITKHNAHSDYLCYDILNTIGTRVGHCEGCIGVAFLKKNGYLIKTVDNSNAPMETTTDIQKNLLDADTQTLMKAGFLSDTLNLTEAGRIALTALMFVENKEALVTAAEEKIAEDAK